MLNHRKYKGQNCSFDPSRFTHFISLYPYDVSLLENHFAIYIYVYLINIVVTSSTVLSVCFAVYDTV